MSETTEATTDHRPDDLPTRTGHAPGAGDSYDNIEPLFAELAALAPEDSRRRAVREQIVHRCLPLAEHIARRFSGRGEAFDDLLQIARLGLVQAVDRFDQSRGSSFLSFAILYFNL